MSEPAAYDDFLKLDMRTGEIVEVQDFPRASNPAYKVLVDFGPDVGTSGPIDATAAGEREELVACSDGGLRRFEAGDRLRARHEIADRDTPDGLADHPQAFE